MHLLTHNQKTQQVLQFVNNFLQSFDVQLLLRQAQVAIDVLNKITQMREGKLGDALVSIENEVSRQILFLKSCELQENQILLFNIIMLYTTKQVSCMFL